MSYLAIDTQDFEARLQELAKATSETGSDVEDWRGQGGDSSDTGTLLAAIAAAKAAGGMQLHLPARTYSIDQELLIDHSHISLIGEGGGYLRAGVANAQVSPRTRFLWVGPAGGTMVRFNTPPLTERCYGGGLQGIGLDGNNFTAARGLVLESWSHGYFFDIFVFACSESHFRTAVVNYALVGTVPADVQVNRFEHCYADAFGGTGLYLTSPAIGWHLTGGSSVNTGNTSFNVFTNCHAYMAKGIAWKLENTDNNYFFAISGGASRDATVYGVELGSADQDSTPSPAPIGASIARHNVFVACQVKAIARSGQTGGPSSASNTFVGKSRANGSPRPVIELPNGDSPMATVNYWDTDGNTAFKTLGLTEAITPLPIVQPGMSQLYIDAATGSIKLMDSSGTVRQILDGTAASSIDQSPLIYSRFLGGVGTPDAQVGDPTVVFTEDFSAGLGTWASTGTVPVIQAAPWGSGQCIKCVTDSSVGVPSSYLTRSITLGRGRIIEFDFYLPQVAGLTPTTTSKQLFLCHLRSGGAYYSLGLRIDQAKTRNYVIYFETPSGTQHTIQPTMVLAANTKYRIRWEMYQGESASLPGHLLLYMDDVLVGGPYTIIDHEQTSVANLWIGAIASNTGAPHTVYIGNLVVSEMLVGSLTNRVTGELSGIEFVGGWAVGSAGVSTTDISTKSPYLDWQGTPTLSLGTSIPHQGADIDSYLGIAVTRLGGTLKNKAWSGSAARYDVAGDPFDIVTVKRLSMTADDVAWGLATYGPSSAYDDSFDVINKASQMTCDARIDAMFALTPYKIVFFDHNHNDRDPIHFGSGPPFETTNIVSITKGASTQVTLASIGSIVVGNGVVLELTGIDQLNHAAQRVQAVAGNVITVNINSSAYTGTFTSGTCTKYDRATVHGSFRFLYHRIKRAGFLAGVDPIIIFNGAPSDYTNGVYDVKIRQVAELIKTIANELDCAFFDEASALNDSLDWHTVYFPDNVHPLETIQRKAIANLWARWLAGGGSPTIDPAAYVPAPVHALGVTPVYTDQSPVIYSRFLGGAGTPDIQVGAPIVAFTENFASGLGTWAPTGPTPTIVAAPWGSGQSILCATDAANPSAFLSRNITLGRGRVAEFDFQLPAVSGQSSVPVGQMGLYQLRSGGAYYSIGLRVDPLHTTFLLQYFETANTTLHSLAVPQNLLEANRKYRVRLEMYQGTSVDLPGSLIMYVDGVQFAGPFALNDFGQTAIASMRFGVVASTTGLPWTAYLSNLTVSDLPTNSIANRLTGTYSGLDFVGGWATGGAGISTVPITTGVWTPSFAFSTPGDSVVTHTAQVGKWTKIGGFVLISFELTFDLNAYTTASGTGDISGLPYQPASPGGSLNISVWNNITYTAASQDVRLECVQATNIVRPKVIGSNGTGANLGTTAFLSSKTGIYIRASGTYWTNA